MKNQNNQRNLVSSKDHKLRLKFFVRGAGSYVALCAVTWSTQLQHWLDLVDLSCDPERHPIKPSRHALIVKKYKLSVRGAELHAPGGPWNCTMRALEKGVCIWIVSVMGDLYHKEYTNVREIIIRFEKGWRGILFSFIATFTVFTDSFLVKWSWPSQVVLHYASSLCIPVSNQTSARTCIQTIVTFFSMIVDHLIFIS